MLDSKQIPNSIVNSLSTSYNDVNTPYPYLTFVTFFTHKSTTDIIQDYNEYVELWNSIKVSTNSVKNYNTSIKDKYIELLKSITLSYTTEEEKRFLTNLDLQNLQHRDILIPFYVNKINDITNYFIDKREDLKFVVEKNKRNNSKIGLIAHLKTFIIDELSQNSAYETISDYTKNALIEDLELDILEKYDTFSHYYDVDPNTSASQYNVENEYYNKYFKNNVLDYNRIAFVDENSYLISAIKEYALIILDIGFGVGFSSNSNEINMLKPKDFIKHTTSNKIDDLNITTYKTLSQKYAGTDMFYVSAFDGDIILDKLFNADASYNNILNKKYTSIQTTPAEKFIDQRNTGTFFLPNNQNISTYNAYTKEYKLKDNLNGVYIYPDPNSCGNIYGASITQLEHYPYTYQTSLTDMFYEKSYKYIKGQLKSNNYQDFTGYKTENKKCTLLNEFESISNQGIITNYKVDIFGNEYAIFKNKKYNIPDGVDVDSNKPLSSYVSSEYLRLNTLSSTFNTESHLIYDGGNIAQVIENKESEVTSDYYEWPDKNATYFYDILLDGGLHNGNVRGSDDPFAGYPYKSYSKSNKSIDLKPAKFFTFKETNNPWDKCYLYDGNCINSDDGFINLDCSGVAYQINNIPTIIGDLVSHTTYAPFIIDNKVDDGIYTQKHQCGKCYFKYSNSDECLELLDVFNFISYKDINTNKNINIINVDIINDVIIITHDNGIIFCKIYVNDFGKISKPSTQIKYYNVENCFYSQYFYVEKTNSVIFTEFKKDNGNGNNVKSAFIPKIYSVSLDQLNETIVYECNIDNNYNGPGYYERLRFGNEKLVSVKNEDVDTPILTYNSLNNLITITFTANIDNIKQIINYTFIDRLSNAELIAYDIYTPIKCDQRLRLIETQMIDNDNNHIFCIFEEEETNQIMVAILLQSANRVIAYNQKIEDSIIEVLGTINQENIISTIENNNYDVDHSIDTTIIMVPISTKNVHYVSPLPLTLIISPNN